VNISATEERLIVRAELCQEDISGLELAVTGTSLVIRGYRDTEPSGAEVVYHRRERGFGQFHRVVNLPVKVDESGAEAFYRHGVLTIVLPRLERQKARRIAVRAARKKEA
jgi:HSP20 family protein